MTNMQKEEQKKYMIDLEVWQQRLISFKNVMKCYDLIDILYNGDYAEITIIENKILKKIVLIYKANIDVWVEIHRENISKIIVSCNNGKD